jgi:hypothetical protein
MVKKCAFTVRYSFILIQNQDQGEFTKPRESPKPLILRSAGRHNCTEAARMATPLGISSCEAENSEPMTELPSKSIRDEAAVLLDLAGLKVNMVIAYDRGQSIRTYKLL